MDEDAFGSPVAVRLCLFAQNTKKTYNTDTDTLWIDTDADTDTNADTEIQGTHTRLAHALN